MGTVLRVRPTLWPADVCKHWHQGHAIHRLLVGDGPVERLCTGFMGPTESSGVLDQDPLPIYRQIWSWFSSWIEL